MRIAAVIIVLCIATAVCSCSTVTPRDPEAWVMVKSWEAKGFPSEADSGVVLEGFDVVPGDEFVLPKSKGKGAAPSSMSGTPMVRYRSRPNEIGLGEVTPVTAIVEGQDQESRLRLVSTLSPESDHRTGLAIDRQAAYQVLVDKAKGFSLAGFHGAFNPAECQEDQGLYMATPYDPDLIPLVLVHGMLAAPSGFFPMLEAIAEHPDLTERYQFWFYYYPTGLPLIENVTGLRLALQQACREVDPDGNDAALSRMVIVGHSMGGLMAKFAVSDPEDHLYNAFFSVPPSQLSLTQDQEVAMRQNLFYEPITWPKRLIFLATPHDGSDFAGTPFGALAAKRVKSPPSSNAFVAGIRAQDTAVLNPVALEFLNDSPNSLHSFDSAHPIWPHLQQIKLPSRVSYHNISGVRDRIVSSSSSEFSGAESDLVVSDGHSVPVHPDAIAEVIRILKAHH